MREAECCKVQRGMAKPVGYNSYLLRIWIFIILSGTCFGDIHLVPRARDQKSNEYRIKRLILKKYDKTTRPVRDDKTTIKVTLAISLYHILDTNEKEQTFTSLLAIRQRWHDEYLTWNSSEYDGLDAIRIPANQIWTPDLVISNFAGDKFNDFMVTNTIVNSDGSILWLYPALIKTYCTLNVKYFPFDSQHCNITFVSWTFSGFELDIVYNESFPNSVYYIPENQEWRVDNTIDAYRKEVIYACCPQPYPDVTFIIHMKRGSLFYIVNLIAPCFLIFLISFLGFFLPVESGEKVNLETTILLALVVFLLMVGEIMPPTPDAIPILGMFFGCTMLMVSVALIMGVVVTNIYAKKDSYEVCPRFIVRLAQKYYPRYMRSFMDDNETMLSPIKSTPRWRKSSCNGGRPGDIISITDGELESLTGDGCCGRCRKISDSAASRTHTYEHRQRRTLPHQPSFDRERNDAEWQMVAKFADRILFWIYAVLSISIQTVLFINMIPPDDGINRNNTV